MANSTPKIIFRGLQCNQMNIVEADLLQTYKIDTKDYELHLGIWFYLPIHPQDCHPKSTSSVIVDLHVFSILLTNPTMFYIILLTKNPVLVPVQISTVASHREAWTCKVLRSSGTRTAKSSEEIQAERVSRSIRWQLNFERADIDPI